MVTSRYSILPTSEDGHVHSKQRLAQILWRTLRQSQTLVRRAALLVLAVLLLFAAFLAYLRTQTWPSIPHAPPTPFSLDSRPSPHTTLSGALDLSARFPAPHYRPACASILSLSPQYASLSASKSNSSIYIALNLINAQSVLPTFIHELPVLFSYMGSHRFYVSVLENGSTDLTPDLLVLLGRALAEVGASFEIVVQGEGMKSNKAGGRRIVELARLRNEALESLYNGQAANKLGIKAFDMVLFMNDIFWCASDMLEIISQHVVHKSHMTCATDWEDNVVYDRWVARTMSGHPFYSQESMYEYFSIKGLFWPLPRPFPYDDYERKRFYNLTPFQVFSCWNGAAVIDPRAFFATPSDYENSITRDESGTINIEESSQMKSENSDPPVARARALETEGAPRRSINGDPSAIRFRTARNDDSLITEKESECFLICVDLWRKGMGKIMMAPKASVAYKLSQYEKVRQDGGRAVRHPIDIELSKHSGTIKGNVDDESDDAIENSRIPWNSTPPTSVVYHDYSSWRNPERWGPWDEA